MQIQLVASNQGRAGKACHADLQVPGAIRGSESFAVTGIPIESYRLTAPATLFQGLIAPLGFARRRACWRTFPLNRACPAVTSVAVGVRPNNTRLSCV
jgi:hypothetical protein